MYIKYIKISLLLISLTTLLISCENKQQEEKKVQEENIVKENKEERYGSDLVGYVTKPGEWKYFNDVNASPNAKQISLTPFDIVTLDIVSTGNQSTAEELRDRSYEGYVNERGVPKENITKKDVVVNNFKGKGLTIKIPDGREIIINLIDYNGNVYFISQEGMSEKSQELSKVVNTWRPNK